MRTIIVSFKVQIIGLEDQEEIVEYSTQPLPNF